MSEKLFISNEEAMLNLGAAFSKKISKGQVIFLKGHLGAGKTTFVRGFLQGLGYEGRVKSPTYTLIEPYFLEAFSIYHFDLYRLNDPEELEFMGFRDYYHQNSICLIEWPEQAEKLLAKPDFLISISSAENGIGRWVEIS
jgi:tRNA threonylcarbamoyladenosine biosynthesis protein TsaE